MLIFIFSLFSLVTSVVISNSKLAVNVQKNIQSIFSSTEDNIVLYDTFGSPDIGFQSLSWVNGIGTCSQSGFYLIFVDVYFLSPFPQSSAVSIFINNVAIGKKDCDTIVSVGSQNVPISCSSVLHTYITAGNTLSVRISTDYDAVVTSKLAAYITSVL